MLHEKKKIASHTQPCLLHVIILDTSKYTIEFGMGTGKGKNKERRTKIAKQGILRHQKQRKRKQIRTSIALAASHHVVRGGVLHWAAAHRRPTAPKHAIRRRLAGGSRETCRKVNHGCEKTISVTTSTHKNISPMIRRGTYSIGAYFRRSTIIQYSIK